MKKRKLNEVVKTRKRKYSEDTIQQYVKKNKIYYSCGFHNDNFSICQIYGCVGKICVKKEETLLDYYS